MIRRLALALFLVVAATPMLAAQELGIELGTMGPSAT